MVFLKLLMLTGQIRLFISDINYLIVDRTGFNNNKINELL